MSNSFFDSLINAEAYPPNEEQRASIYSASNTVVSAGAGSGKTTVLSYRFLRLVLDGCPVDRILTLTFTRKAALEMRERIHNRLFKAGNHIGESNLAAFSNASICTLDSFSSEIVRSDAAYYGISRDFGIQGVRDAEEMNRRLADAFLSSPQNADIVRALSAIYAPDRIYTDFFGVILDNVLITGDYKAEHSLAFFSNDLKERAKLQYDKLAEVLNHLSGEVSGSAEDTRKLLLEKLLKDEIGVNDDFNFRKRSEFTPEAKEYIQLFREAKNIYIPLQSALISQQDTDLLQLGVERFAAMIQEEKRRTSLLSFADVAAAAIDVLKRNKDIRAYYKNRFDYIMIDEFQDNNSLQKDLLFLLAERKDILTEGIPSASDLEEGKLFFVGDEKQSIYRFRGADVSVFRELQDTMGAIGGAALNLSTNYRSSALLVEHFNKVFERVFSDAEEGYEARFEKALNGNKSNAASSITLSLFDRDSEIENGLNAGECEAEYIGDLVDSMLNGDDYLINGQRPKASDIAILMRNGGGQINIERALRNRAIPYILSETRSLMLEAIAGDIYSFLQSIVYPEDKRAFAALYRSPFVHLSDSAISSMQDITAPDPSLFDLEDRRKWELFSPFYEEIKAEAFSLTLPALLDKLWNESGYSIYIGDSGKYSSYREHFEYLYSYAVDFLADGRSLTDYVKFLRDNLGASSKLEETAVLHEVEDGVKIMTIHKSKGLEFPIVIIANMGSKDKSEVSRNIFTYKGHLIASADKSVVKVLNEDEKAQSKAELKRVLYVGLTRAEKHLVLTGSYKLSKAGSIGDSFLNMYLEGVGYDFGSKTTKLGNIKVEEITPRTDFSYKRSANAALETLAEKYSCADESAFGVKRNRISVTSLKEETFKEGRKLASTEADSLIASYGSDAFGTLCHLILEKRMKNESVDVSLCTISENKEENELLFSAALSLSDNFFGSSLFRDKVDNKKTQCEVRFYSYDNDDAALEGVVDLFVLGDEYNLVIDYKSDSVKRVDEHKSQVVTYVRVMEEIFKKKCYGTLFYLREGSEEPLWDSEGSIVNL